MSTCSRRGGILFASLAATATLAASPAAVPDTPGTPITEAEIAAWDISVEPDGTGLPAGSGSVAEGARLFAGRCALCHGADGKGGKADALVGGAGSLTSEAPVKTVGSYWPFATTLFDYVRRAMPYFAPGSLADDEVYAITAYVLHLNGIVAEDAVLDAERLVGIRMPNREGFASWWPAPPPD